MNKRLISCFASEIDKMSSQDLKNSIIASEGRIILGETVVTSPPLLEGITNAEIMASFSADMILLNEYDVFTKYIYGMEETENPIATIKKLTGRPIGINLEPIDNEVQALEELIKLPKGRIASKETFIEASNQGIAFICLTGNPATGVSNASIEKSIIVAKEHFHGLVFAGKMHSAGIKEKVLSEKNLLNFIKLGADGVLIPAVGTVPGINEYDVGKIVEKVKALGAITISAVGTSQESADTFTIREIGLSNKRTGVDIHHLGDGGYGRMPDPENLMALSLCIRGKRHTYFRMSQSINR
ncbi:MAG: phosphonomutase [Anaerocolumna sp.]|jgi:hypothetical protein|nr:phosphonomutase [Anaerocolumna sp.]